MSTKPWKSVGLERGLVCVVSGSLGRSQPSMIETKPARGRMITGRAPVCFS